MRMMAEKCDESLGNAHGRGYVKRHGIENYTEENDDEQFENLLTEKCGHYCLKSYMPDPAWDNFIMPPQILCHNIVSPPFDLYEDINQDDVKQLGSSHRLMDIDIRLPLQPQIDCAHISLKKEQSKLLKNLSPLSSTRRFQNHQLIEYLLSPVRQEGGELSIDWRPQSEGLYRRLKLIDMCYALPLQINHHYATLKAEQSKTIGTVLRPTFNNRKQKVLIQYLRILDAYVSDANNDKILSELFSGQRRYAIANSTARTAKGSYSPAHCRLYRDRDEARRLRDTDWITLLH